MLKYCQDSLYLSHAPLQYPSRFREHKSARDVSLSFRISSYIPVYTILAGGLNDESSFVFNYDAPYAQITIMSLVRDIISCSSQSHVNTWRYLNDKK
jgi:hypothetical protein